MTDFAQTIISGIAVGSVYALVVLSYVIVLKATGVISFMQGTFVLTGAYLTYAFQQMGAPFYGAVVLGVLGGAAAGFLVELVALRPLRDKPLFTVVMVTIALSIFFEPVFAWQWGTGRLSLSDPWGLETFSVGGVIVAESDIARFLLAVLVFILLYLFFTRTRLGTAMRATASDQEAAMAQGIGNGKVFGLSWAMAAGVAAIAGVLLTTGGRGIDPSLSIVAILVFPALVMGGLDSAGGAVVGGLTLGLIEELTKSYSASLFPAALGTNLHIVTPYALLLVVLVLKPYGLFGTKAVERL